MKRSMLSLSKVLAISSCLLLAGCFEATKKAAEATTDIQETCKIVRKLHVVANENDTRPTREKSVAGLEWYEANCK